MQYDRNCNREREVEKGRAARILYNASAPTLHGSGRRSKEDLVGVIELRAAVGDDLCSRSGIVKPS